MKGFSLIEMLIVLSILAIMAVTALPFITGYQADTEIGTAAESIVAVLRQAQGKAVAGEGANKWGVHFDTTNHFFELFQGNAYGSATDKAATYLTARARLSNLALFGGGTDVIFDRLTGKTSQYGTGTGSRAVCVTNSANASACKKGIVITANGKIGLQ